MKALQTFFKFTNSSRTLL